MDVYDPDWMWWRWCKPCDKETNQYELDVKSPGYIPYVCSVCGTTTALLGYNDDDSERVEEVSDGL